MRHRERKRTGSNHRKLLPGGKGNYVTSTHGPESKLGRSQPLDVFIASLEVTVSPRLFALGPPAKEFKTFASYYGPSDCERSFVAAQSDLEPERLVVAGEKQQASH